MPTDDRSRMADHHRRPSMTSTDVSGSPSARVSTRQRSGSALKTTETSVPGIVARGELTVVGPSRPSQPRMAAQGARRRRPRRSDDSAGAYSRMLPSGRCAMSRCHAAETKASSCQMFAVAWIDVRPARRRAAPSSNPSSNSGNEPHHIPDLGGCRRMRQAVNHRYLLTKPSVARDRLLRRPMCTCGVKPHPVGPIVIGGTVDSALPAAGRTGQSFLG